MEWPLRKYFIGYNNYYQQPQQQVPIVPASATTIKNDEKVKITTKIPRIKSDSGGQSKKGELAPQDPEPDLETQKLLLKDLKPEDFVMETPLAAYFTLIVG